MRYICTVGILLIAPLCVSAQSSPLRSIESMQTECIDSLQLSDVQVRSGWYQYKIDRCVRSLREREGHQSELNRLLLRQQRYQEKGIAIPRSIRPQYHESVLRVGNGSVREERLPGLKLIRRTPTRRSIVRTKENRAQTFAQRSQNARIACRNVQKSFYANCVRQEMRKAGTGVPLYQESAFDRARRQNVTVPVSDREKRNLLSKDFQERSARAREECKDQPKSFQRNCVRGWMRKLGTEDRERRTEN